MSGPNTLPDLERGLTVSSDETCTDQKTLEPERVTLVKRGKKYVLNYDNWYRNNLMLLVGYLEFFNALDFPANVWNDIPIPKFAQILMIVGGTLILLASILAILDFRRSFRNIRKLRKERKYLSEKLRLAQRSRTSTENWEAWLELNFRELGWEVFDRILMDSFVGFSSILVGPGTIMAVAGANPHIFRASNLLSGYIGNSFVAVYGFINSFWAVYLFVRATRHKRLVLAWIKDASLKQRAHKIFKRHQLYAALNGITLIISGAGSLVSATMWWGYVILIPCVVSSVYCNILWRKGVGYDRPLFPSSTETAATLLERIRKSVNFQQQVNDNSLKRSPTQVVMSFIEDHGMMGPVAVELSNKNTTRIKLIKGMPESFDVNASALAALEASKLTEALQTCTRKITQRGTLDEERFLFELLGSMLSVSSKQNVKAQ